MQKKLNHLLKAFVKVSSSSLSSIIELFISGGCIGNIVPVSPTKNSQSPGRNVYLDIQIRDSPNEKNKFV